MKRCNRCKQEKPLSSFYNISKNKDGKHHTCKECLSPAKVKLHSLNLALNKLNELEFQQKHGANTIKCDKCNNIAKKAKGQKNICEDCYKDNINQKARAKPKMLSFFRGVSHIRRSNSWVASIYLGNDKTKRIICKTEIEAAKAYNQYVIENNLNRPLNIIESEKQ